MISRSGVLLEFERTPFGYSELSTTGSIGVNKAANPHLSADGLTLVFAAPDGEGDLYISRRIATGGPWGPAEPITELNTAQNEADPWLSADQAGIYFAREGVLLYAHK